MSRIIIGVDGSGVSGVVVREAACPVIVVPNGARRAVGSILGTSVAALAV